MFPKHTVTTSVAIPPEKSPITSPTGQKHTAVVFMVDNTDIQVAVDNDKQWRTKRAAICACVFILTVLILVGGTLGAIAIVSVRNSRLQTSEAEPSNHDGYAMGDALPTHLPKSTQRIKIDDSGLYYAEPVTPDLLDVEYVTDVDDAGSDIEAAASSDPITPSSYIESSDSSSSSSSSEPNDYYRNDRNWVSSSFPYDGYYMRGGVGIPPWEKSDWVGPSMVVDPTVADHSGMSEASGDGADVSGDGAPSDQEYGDESGNGSGGDGIPSSVDYDPTGRGSSPHDYDIYSSSSDSTSSDYYYFS